jgi:hypothetical protein
MLKKSGYLTEFTQLTGIVFLRQNVRSQSASFVFNDLIGFVGLCGKLSVPGANQLSTPDLT